MAFENWQDASSKRIVADLDIFASNSTGEVLEEEWENLYQSTMEQKYRKNTRNFSKTIEGKKWPLIREPRSTLFLGFEEARVTSR